MQTNGQDDVEISSCKYCFMKTIQVNAIVIGDRTLEWFS